MRSAHRLGQGGLDVGDGDEMDVIGQQAVADDTEPEAPAVLLEGFEIEDAIVLGEVCGRLKALHRRRPR